MEPEVEYITRRDAVWEVVTFVCTLVGAYVITSRLLDVLLGEV